MSKYYNPEALASTQWVEDHLYDPQVKLIEVVESSSPSRGMHHYTNGHILGALVWDIEMVTVTHGILDKKGLEAQLSRLGVTPETTVVVYSARDNLLATYAFWLLKMYGHKNIRLLNGYKQKWLDENRPTTNKVPLIAPATYEAEDPNWNLRANHEYVLQSIGKKDRVIMDTRSVEMYNGVEKAGAVRGGHIPGAVNLAAHREINQEGSSIGWRTPTANPDGTFKSKAELQTIFDGLGVTPDKEIITYCVRGGLSTHAWITLTQLLGYPNVREYDCSWREWGNREDAPIET